jgi:hypothetical protein
MTSWAVVLASFTRPSFAPDTFALRYGCPPIRRHADEGGQKRMMNVDQRAARFGNELRQADLHVPS